MKNYDLARKILGQDFISPEEIMSSKLGIRYSNEQLVSFTETVPEQEILEWCRDNNFILVAGPSYAMSLLNSFFHFKGGYWFYDQKFARDKVEPKWYMICKNPVPESTSRNFNEQEILVSGVELVPNCAEFAWAITVYKKIRDTYLFNKVSVRTSSPFSSSCNDRALFGHFDDNGLGIGNAGDDYRSDDIGIVVARN